MSIIFSGLPETDTFSCLGLDTNARAPTTWCSPSDFAINASASANDSRRWVWLYRAPWALPPATEQDDWQALLERWTTQQRAALKLRRQLGSRLVLINVDQVSSTLICAELGLPQPQLSADTAPFLLSSTIASLFEQAAPHYWEMYEALEAAAWLPVGEPQFRSNQPDLSETSLFSLLNMLQLGLAWPNVHAAMLKSELSTAELQRKLQDSYLTADRETALRQQLAEENDKFLRRLQEMTDQNRKAAQAYEAHQESLTKENELILMQLHQVQEELESYYLANKEMATTIGQSQQTMQRARGVVTRLISH